MRWSPISAKPSGLRGRSLRGVAGHIAERHVDGLADQEFRTGGLAVEIAGIARVKLPAAIGTEAIDIVQIERRRAEIFHRVGIGLLVAERRQIQRDVVIDELPEIGEAGRHLGVVPGGVAGVRVFHRVGEFMQRTVIDRQRLEGRKHPTEHAGIVVPGKRIEKLSGRMTASFAMAGLDIHFCCHHVSPVRKMLRGEGRQLSRLSSLKSNSKFQHCPSG